MDYETVKSADVEGILVLPLYGAMETHYQKEVFDPAPKFIRKIVVSTVNSFPTFHFFF